MLCLSREPQEAVIITAPDGTEIRVSINKVRGDKVTIGFEAPANFIIDREEVYNAKKGRS